MRFARCARCWGRISPQAWGTLRLQVHLGSAFRAYICRATTHLAMCLDSVKDRQGSRHKFLAVQPHMPHVHDCGPVQHLVGLWCCETDISKNRARAPAYDARIMGCCKHSVCWCIKLFKLSSASCGMCLRNISECVLCVCGIPEYVLFSTTRDRATMRSTRIWFNSAV